MVIFGLHVTKHKFKICPYLSMCELEVERRVGVGGVARGGGAGGEGGVNLQLLRLVLPQPAYALKR